MIETAGWAEYAVLNAKDLQLVQQIEWVSETHYLGAFGLTALTAYYGMKVIARAGPQDTVVVVSGAAGVTGSMAVQVAKKMLGCKRVVGMAGSD